MGMTNVRAMALPVLAGLALATIGAAPLTAQNPAEVSAEEFASLEWLEGRWVGTGGEAGAFYEQYRVLDDHTIEVTTWADADFTRQASRSTIQFLSGFIMKSGSDEPQSVVTKLEGTTIRFEWAGGAQPGYSWNMVSEDEWVAVMDRKGDAPVVYNMRRVSGAP